MKLQSQFLSAHPIDELSSRQGVRGFSLIELLLAMVLGLILIGGVIYVFVSGNRSNANNQEQVRLVDNARVVLETISHDIRMAGSWAGSGIDASREAALVLPLISTDCEPGWYFNVGQRIYGADNHNPYGAGTRCLSAGSGRKYVNETDVLTVRYAIPIAIADDALAENMAYIQVAKPAEDSVDLKSGGKSEVFVYLPPAPPPSAGPDNNYQIQSMLYFINADGDSDGDGTPSLWRLRLAPGVVPGPPVLAAEMLAEGVEQMQFQFGVDTDDDGMVNSYVDGDTGSAVIDWNNTESVERIMSVRVWLLLRSEQPIDTVTPVSSYQLGSYTYTVPAGTEQYLRQVFSGVVEIKSKGAQ